MARRLLGISRESKAQGVVTFSMPLPAFMKMMWQCGRGMNPWFLPALCPQVIPQVSSSPSLPWGHLRYLCVPEPSSLPSQGWPGLALPTRVTLAPYHGTEGIPSQVSHSSIIFPHPGTAESSRVSFKHVLWIKGKPLSHHTKENTVTALPWKSPFPDSRLLKCGKNENSLNYVNGKLGHGQNILLRKIQFHRNAGMQEQDPDHGLKGEKNSRKHSQFFPPPQTH